MKFHHVGLPTKEERPWSARLDEGKLQITDSGADPFSIEWLKFDDDSPMPKALQNGPHLAFMVDDLDKELLGKEILIEPFQPFPDLRCAFIMHLGVPVELMQNV